MARLLSTKFEDVRAVTVKAVYGDYASWTAMGDSHAALADVKSDEGTLAEFENYVNELKFFAAQDSHEYWIMNFGKARADVGIAALPLLVAKRGALLVDRWTESECVRETLLRFYDLVDGAGELAVLRPKPAEWLKQMEAAETYDWCFSWDGERSMVKHYAGPTSTSGSMEVLQGAVACSDFSGNFSCDAAGNNCISCYAALMAATKRGFKVKESLKKAGQANDEHKKVAEAGLREL